VRSVIKKYSDHISVPVRMLKETAAAPAMTMTPEEKPAARVQGGQRGHGAVDAQPQDVSDDEYKEFYKHVAHDFEDPLTWSHNRVEGKLDYTSLLFIPARAPFDLWNRDANRGVEALRAAHLHHG
jgi:molecular chaperone HtpG